MHLAQPAVLSPRQLLQFLRVHVKLWLLPAVVVAAIVGAYAVLHQATWEASQALIVRNGASGGEQCRASSSIPRK